MSVMSPRTPVTSRLRPQYQELLFRFVFHGVSQVLVLRSVRILFDRFVLGMFLVNKEVKIAEGAALPPRFLARVKNASARCHQDTKSFASANPL